MSDQPKIIHVPSWETKRRGLPCMPWMVGALLLVALIGLWPRTIAEKLGSVPASVTPRPALQSRSISYRAAPPQNPVQSETGLVVQTLHGSNLRSGPGLEFDIVEVAPAGHSVLPIGQSPSHDWLKLARGTWIWFELVDRVPANLPVLEADSKIDASILTKTLTTLRAGPSKFHSKIGEVNSGQPLMVVGRNREGTWLAVQTTGTSHKQWVQTDQVSFPYIELLPILVSEEAPNTEALFNFLVEHAAKQTDAASSVRVEVQTCGQANAFAGTRSGQKFVVLCQEFLTQMWLTFSQIETAFPSSLEYTSAATSGILAVALHEFGHLLMEDPVAARGIDNLGQSVAKAQDIASRYGTTYVEDMADLYATVILIELAKELGENPETSNALPTEYIAIGPIMMSYVLADRRNRAAIWTSDSTHSPPQERLATSICAGLDGSGPTFLTTLNNVSEFRDRLHELSADRGQTCISSASPEPSSYAALVREIEGLFANSMPAWW